MANDPAPQLGTNASIGATIDTAYAGRTVKVYAILESEVQQISLFNTLSTVAFSLASSFVSVAVGIWVNDGFTAAKTAAGEVSRTAAAEILVKTVAPGLCVGALILVLLGLWARDSRGTTWKTIREESKTKP